MVNILLLLSTLDLMHLAMPWSLPLWLLAKPELLLGYVVYVAFVLRTVRDPGEGLLSVLSPALLDRILYLALDKS